METSFILGPQDDVLGIRLHVDDVAKTDAKEVSKLIAEYGLVVMKKTKTPPKDYYQWQLDLGYHQPAEIWCNDPEMPIFFLVTNRQITKKEMGLFGHGELDWHCNILFTPDGEEIVGLYGSVVQPGCDTILANSIPLWKNLPDHMKDFYKDLQLKITNVMADTYENKLAHYVLPSAEQADFNKKRANLSIERAINFDAADIGKYPQPRFAKENLLKFVPNHPLGTEGIYFPHLNLSYFADANGKQLEDHKKVYQEFKHNYIDSGRYVYSHAWDEGDVYLMDQLTTIHKRSMMNKDLPRELLRTACWYKTDVRKHFGHSI